MKNMLSTLLSATTISILFALTSTAQNTFPSTGAAGVGTTTPNAASLLEVKSTTKGVLFPRMTQAQRNAIASPVEGLLIYQTDHNPGFYYYEGGWSAVTTKGANKSLSNLTAPTAVSVDLLPGTDATFNLGSSAFQWKGLYLSGNIYVGSGTLFLKPMGFGFALGQTAGNSNTGSQNTLVGYGAGYVNTTGAQNTFLGFSVGYFNTTASFNTFLGSNSGYFNTTGDYNTFVGWAAGYNNTTGIHNVMIGAHAGAANAAHDYNTCVGYYAGSASHADGNTFIGESSGLTNTSGASNTFVGTSSGRLQTSGHENTMMGHVTGYSNTNGYWNTFIGENCGYDNTTGYENTYLGKNAGFGNVIGNTNTCIGYGATINNGVNYATAIGAGALASTSNSFVIGGSGSFAVNVGIGTSTPAYELDVCGTIRAKEVRVATGWCDYVFEKNYHLPSLSSVEQFIQQNNHLPDIPSADEVETNGIQVGQMSAAMMKKIEELTLYVIEQDKEIKALQQQVEALNK